MLFFLSGTRKTLLRPYIVMHSNKTDKVILAESTIPTEDNIIDRHTDKETKYKNSLGDVKMNGWK